MAKKSMIARTRKKRKFRVRENSRCRICGRARAVYRKFAICRLCFRELSLRGEIPGIIKAAW
ncbi:MAG: type Z 30S ribosomal protein S14 [Candidatus Aminicenantes bacterium]|nr:type Z 30S ribosomal protein S14 [Candidatus Aminicenantes bacterium]